MAKINNKSSYSDMEQALINLISNHTTCKQYYSQDTEDINMIAYEQLKSKLLSMSYEELDEMFSYPEEDWKYYIPITEDIFGKDKNQWKIIYKAKRIWEEGYSVSEMIATDAEWDNLETSDDFNNRKFELAEREWEEDNDDAEQIKTDCIKDCIADLLSEMHKNGWLPEQDIKYLESKMSYMTEEQITDFNTYKDAELNSKKASISKKRSDAAKKTDNSNKKKQVRDNSTNIIYDSIGQAAEMLHTTAQTISRWVKSGKFDKI